MSEGKRLRALLVEDSPDDAELVVLELQSGGYKVEHQRVDTEAAMRDELGRAHWDVVLSDFAMPAFSGTAALAVLKQTGLDIPFIIVSGTVGEEAAVAAMRSGADDYVLKRSLARLCPAIERELREAGLRAEQRKMQEHLLISDRMASVGILAAGVAHEINNPLAAVIINLDLLARNLPGVAQVPSGLPGGDVAQQLRDAREGASRLRAIVRDLKLFSRSPEEDRQEPIDLRAVLDSSLRMAWNEIRHRAQLIKDYGDIPPVRANEARLGQVFLNLIVNAAQAIAEGDVEGNAIHVTTRRDRAAGSVVVEVRDTGAGIPAENLSRIFDAFFTTKPIGVGTGLGLSICHRIVAGLGGKIEVESQVGKGTAFRVWLPAAVERLPDSVPAPSPIPARRRGRVLIVDDEVIVTRAISRIIGDEHDVAVAASGADALERLAAGERFDVILCDLMMPQMTGMELHARLVATLPREAERLVFMTGGAFTESARRFLDRHPDRQVEKPIDMAGLRTFINSRIT